jgi:hypothetical protein
MTQSEDTNERWLAPPPNNILANFALFIVSCTTPLATPNPFHPPSEGPPSGIGTKSGQGRTNQSLLETIISLKVDGGTYSTSGLHIPPSNVTQGEEILRGMTEAVKTPHIIWFSTTIYKESVDEVEALKKDARSTTIAATNQCRHHPRRVRRRCRIHWVWLVLFSPEPGQHPGARPTGARPHACIV